MPFIIFIHADDIHKLAFTLSTLAVPMMSAEADFCTDGTSLFLPMEQGNYDLLTCSFLVESHCQSEARSTEAS